MGVSIVNNEVSLAEVSSLEDFFTAKLDCKYSVSAPFKSIPDDCDFYYLNELAKEDRKDALSIMQPLIWTTSPVWEKINRNESGDIQFSLLHDARIYGGRITKRTGKLHESGQLLLTNNFEFINASYGVLDGSRSLPKDLVSVEDGEISLNLEGLVDECIYLKGDYYFLGSLHRHFGHFIVEGLSRLWALDMLPENIRKEIKFIYYEDSVKPFSLELLKLCGIDAERLISAPRNAIIERIFVPDISYRTHHWNSRLQQLTYDKISKCITKRHVGSERIYLSRRNIPDRPLRNELEIENLFSQLGFDIITPEKISITEQISIVKYAKVIAGPVGSQMYLSAFNKLAEKILILAPANFCLPDDMLLSTCKPTNLHVVLGTCIDLSLKKNERSWGFEFKELEVLVKEILN
ncbi:DUF563 domain-containing protein [Rahnella inusitata]|uniref:glycosyltransferase family 61 protein n=1 Tax=Rahnella inusitata TaxID=58169 RepID=UPI0039BE30AA